MFLIYRLLINIFFPLIIIITLFRKLINKEDKTRFKEKIFSTAFNFVRDKNKKLLWFHAASLGELKSIIPLIIKLNVNNYDFLITTGTLSSSQFFEKKFSKNKNIIHRFFPFDKVSNVKKFIAGWTPDLVVFVDSEIWPNFILEIKKNQIPLILLNARITKKTFLRWKLIPKTAKKIFQLFDCSYPCSKETKNYLNELGLKKIKYFGNLKLSTEIEKDIFTKKKQETLKHKNLWCAVSTHKQEESICINTHLNLKKINKNVITIIIPRHIDRSQNIKTQCEKKKLSYQIIFEGDQLDVNKEVIIVSSYGVTANFLKLCNSVFIGKSMIKKLELVGGQDPIEAAKLGCKIYHGPYVYNFNEIYGLLKEYNMSEEIKSEFELSEKLSLDFKSKDASKEDKIKSINNLGKKILDETNLEIKKLINK